MDRASTGEDISRPVGPIPWWLWPNLLSLDAPLIAITWQLLFARCFNWTLRPATVALLATGTWTVYVLDRLLDTRRPESLLEPGERHRFYERHKRAFVLVLALVAVASAAAAVTLLRPSIRDSGLIVLGFVCAYLLLAHALGGRFRRWFPKEYAVGIIFAIGVTLPFRPLLERRQPVEVAALVLFAAACQVNTIGIEYWDSLESGKTDLSPLTRWAGSHLTWAAVVLSSTSLALVIAVPSTPMRPVLMAILASGLAFAWIVSASPRIPSEVRHVLMDVALLTPLAGMISRL